MTLPELDYSVRVSARARHARIVVRPGGAIEVVLPKGVSERQVPAMLKARSRWLESAVLRMREAVSDRPDATPPDRIALPGIREEYRIDYRYHPDKRLQLRQAEDMLHLSGPVHEHALVRQRLHAWLKAEARVHLPRLLAETAREMNLTYQKVTIRLQKTRWGSCSVGGNISLNARLLLLPPQLLRYVLVHELAHLRHHNHSPAFWQEVARYEPDYRCLRRELVEAGRQMPGWVRV